MERCHKPRNLADQRIPSFKNHGKVEHEKGKVINGPNRHQKITENFVFDVKHCGKFKARLVADGHLTKEPTQTVYSKVVSLRNLRLAISIAEHNNLQLLEMHTSKHSQKKISTLWLSQNLKSYKDMFLYVQGTLWYKI